MKRFLCFLAALVIALSLGACKKDAGAPAEAPGDEPNHAHDPYEGNNIIEHEKIGYCGNTITYVEYNNNGETEWTSRFEGNHSVALTDLLTFLDFKEDACDCKLLSWYTVRLEDGNEYTVSINLSFVRFGDKQAQLTKEQLDTVIAAIDYAGENKIGCSPEERLGAKPVIYLYPEKKTDVSVKLLYNGRLTVTYPEYGNGWNVTAYPGGRLLNHADGREYSYLFWEGVGNTEYNMKSGFVVKGEDTAGFLQDMLSKMGLLPHEYNEFIVYWLPKMQDNKYNLISFQGREYTDSAVLDIDPVPDSLLRVFMAFQPLSEPVDIKPQEITPFERSGFTVVEWGGTEIK